MTADIINLAERRQKKEIEDSIARGRVPLVTTHLNPTNQDDMVERIMRIKHCLQRISEIMSKLDKK